MDQSVANPQYSAYYPYGRPRQSVDNLPTDRLFTDKALDKSTGLYDYGARLYDGELGRFVSADPHSQSSVNDSRPFMPLVVSYAQPNLAMGLSEWQEEKREASAPLDPQLLNRYSYSRNNPTTLKDPSGNYVVVTAAIGGILGFGAYAITHRDNFDWGGAAQWTTVGALAGSGVGAVAELAGVGATTVWGSTATAATAGVTASSVLQHAQKIGGIPVQSVTDASKLSSQLTSKSSILGVVRSGDLGNLSNPQVQKAVALLNDISSTPDRIWQGTWKGQTVIEYIKGGIGVVRDPLTGALITVLERGDLTKLEQFVQNNTAVWLK